MTDDMIRKTSFDMQKPGINENWLHNTFNCPSCGTETLNGDCPAFAPDYVCMECHLEWMDDHDDWREDTMQRIAHHATTTATTVDEDPHYTTKDRKCKSCGEMNTGSDTCSGPCGQCWSCNCDCDGDA